MITLLGEDLTGQTPTVAELGAWADQFGLHHPVVADPGWQVTARFLASYTIALPSMHQLAPGMEVIRRDTWVTENQVRANLPQ